MTTTTTYSETQAAKRLGVVAATLRTWRLRQILRDDIATSTPSIAPGGTPKVRYAADIVDQIAESGRTDDLFAQSAAV